MGTLGYINDMSQRDKENRGLRKLDRNSMKNVFYLIVFLSVWSLKLNAQDIDFPLSRSEIEKYESRVRIQRLPNVTVTHPDAYKIRTQQSVYSPSTKQITLDVINVNAPTAEPEYHWMKHWKDGKWAEFPFIDNLVFAGVGRDLSKGDTLPEYGRRGSFPWIAPPRLTPLNQIS